MVHASVRIVIPSKKRREVMEFLNGMTEQTKVKQGCIFCRVYRDVKEEDVIMLDELWRNEDDLNRHLRSNEYRELLMIIEMAVEPPEIMFHAISDSTGIETIEKARSDTMEHGQR